MIGTRSPDLKFVEALKSSLAHPIQQTFDELVERYKKPSFRRNLDTWMVSLEPGKSSMMPNGNATSLNRLPKFACYLLVNKLVFHEALLKKYNRNLDPLNAPPRDNDRR